MSTPYRVIPDDGLRCQCGAIGGSLLTGGPGLPAFYLCGKCGSVGHVGAGPVTGRVEVPRAVAQPTTPAPAWEWFNSGHAVIKIGHFAAHIYHRDRDLQWRGDVGCSECTMQIVGPYPTALEAARAAVATLRAIVGPVVAALDDVPDLDGDAP